MRFISSGAAATLVSQPGKSTNRGCRVEDGGVDVPRKAVAQKGSTAAPGTRAFDADQTTSEALMTQGQKQEAEMSATEIANLHFSAAIAEAEAAGMGHDSVCRSLLGLVVAKYLESRSVSDVQSELRFVADNCDPGTDFMFMRP